MSPLLTIRVRDTRDDTVKMHTYSRSPVTVGRRAENTLHLDARNVSRYHGAFVFGKGVLRYVDLRSKNGTKIQGQRIAAEALIDVLHADVIGIGPFWITLHLSLVDPTWIEPPLDLATPVDLGPVPEVLQVQPALTLDRAAPDDIARRWDVGRAPPPLALLARAIQVVDVVASLIVIYRNEMPEAASPLRSAMSPEDIVEYVLAPDSHDEDRLDEFAGFMTELFRKRLRPGSGGAS